MYDILIIGAGPAGLSAGIYGLRAGKKVLVINDNKSSSQIINANKIDNYPGLIGISGFDFISNLKEQVETFNGEIIDTTINSVDLVNKVINTDKGVFNGKTIIIATGCTNKKLNIDNESNYIGKGLSYCATCDGNFFRNRDVAVVGGGNTALDDCLYLSNIVNKVYLIHRRDEFRGDNSTVEKLKCLNNVEFVLNSNVSKLNGDNILQSIDVDTNGVINNIKVNGLFIAIGQLPNSDLFDIEKDSNGYIVSNDTNTNIPGIFVAGDVRTKSLRQLTTAVSDGSIAATNAINYLN